MTLFNLFEIETCHKKLNTCRPNANVITAMCLWVQGNSAGLQECGRSTLTMGQYVWPYNGLPVIFFWSLFYLQNIFLGKQGWLRPIKKNGAVWNYMNYMHWRIKKEKKKENHKTLLFIYNVWKYNRQSNQTDGRTTRVRKTTFYYKLNLF